MKYLPELFERNRAWAARLTGTDPQYFEHLCEIQRPSYLWIGCADSRVPANEIVGLAPGEMFVQRNVANLVQPDDPNCMAVVQYAVEVLGVQHVIVCGHYGCGGVRAAMEGGTEGYVDRWLTPLRQLAASEHQKSPSISSLEARWDHLCEASVRHQVAVLGRTPVVQKAWREGRTLALHGWIYSLRNGLLRDLEVTAARPEDLPTRERTRG